MNTRIARPRRAGNPTYTSAVALAGNLRATTRVYPDGARTFYMMWRPRRAEVVTVPVTNPARRLREAVAQNAHPEVVRFFARETERAQREAAEATMRLFTREIAQTPRASSRREGRATHRAARVAAVASAGDAPPEPPRPRRDYAAEVQS
jgi:hypothetical protein